MDILMLAKGSVECGNCGNANQELVAFMINQ